MQSSKVVQRIESSKHFTNQNINTVHHSPEIHYEDTWNNEKSGRERTTRGRGLFGYRSRYVKCSELNCCIYRVAGLSCPEAGGCKSAILRGFPNVFSLFGPCKVGAISFRYSWTTGMKKKFRNLVLKKGQISEFAQIDIFLISNFFGYLSITFFKTIQM